MEQNNAKMGEIGAYPCRADPQQLLDQECDFSSSVNDFQDACMDGGGGRL